MVVSYGSAEFKAHCLQILDEVAATGQTVLLTKRGRPVARLVPVEASEPLAVFGLLKGSAQWSDSLSSAEESWNADRS